MKREIRGQTSVDAFIEELASKGRQPLIKDPYLYQQEATDPGWVHCQFAFVAHLSVKMVGDIPIPHSINDENTRFRGCYEKGKCHAKGCTVYKFTFSIPRNFDPAYYLVKELSDEDKELLEILEIDLGD